MAVSISSITTNTNDGSSATISVTTSESPTATQVGDLVVVIHGNGVFTISTMPTPTSTGSPVFTNIVDADGGSGEGHLRCWYYYANTGGAQTVSVTETGLADEEKTLAVYVLAGAAGSSPIDGTPATNTSSSSVTSQDCSAITTTNSDSICIQAITSGAAVATTAYAPPGGGTNEQYDIRVAPFLSAAGGTKQLSASGSTGTFTWTATGASPYTSATFAIKAAAGGATDAPDAQQSLPFPVLLQVLAQRQQPASNIAGDVSAPAEVASATGTAFDAVAAVGATAEATTGTGTAFDTTVATTAASQAATGTGAGLDATSAITTSAEQSTGTGNAADGTGSVATTAENAPGAGSASDATPGIAAASQAATSTGTAPDGTDAITVNAEVASSTGTASDATVSTSSNVNAPAELAPGTAAASDATAAVNANAECATGTGTSFGITLALSALAEPALVAGTAFAVAVAVSGLIGTAHGPLPHTAGITFSAAGSNLVGTGGRRPGLAGASSVPSPPSMAGEID